jgi:rhomboid protease GluP
VTWWLLCSNVLLWLFLKGYGMVHMVDGLGLPVGRIGNAEVITAYTGMKIVSAIDAGQSWRLASSMFVHLSFLHILMNGYALYILGPTLEKFYGGRRFWVLYLISGLVSAWASYRFNEIDSGGASGAIYGLIGALLVFGVKYRSRLPLEMVKAFTVRLLPWVVFGIGIGFFDAIPWDNAAHLGGLFAGMALALVFGSELVRSRSFPMADAVLWICAISGVVFVLWCGVQWSEEIDRCTVSLEAFSQCYPMLLSR